MQSLPQNNQGPWSVNENDELLFKGLEHKVSPSSKLKKSVKSEEIKALSRGGVSDPPEANQSDPPREHIKVTRPRGHPKLTRPEDRRKLTRRLELLKVTHPEVTST